MDYDIADLGLAAEGNRRIEWAARRMPVLAAIGERFERERPLAGTTVAACMHVTTETANLMYTLRLGGATVALAASNPLSTQDDAAAALVEAGIPVFAIRGEDADTFYRHLNAILDTSPTSSSTMGPTPHPAAQGTRPTGDRRGDGGDHHRGDSPQGDGRRWSPSIPVVAVNDSDTKHLFDNRHGTGQSSLDGILRATNILFAGKTVVVAGYGDCGWGIATRASGLGAKRGRRGIESGAGALGGDGGTSGHGFPSCG